MIDFPQTVIPAKAGTHSPVAPAFEPWVPAFAGMTAEELSTRIGPITFLPVV